MTRYFQRVGQPGRIEHVEDHWPASIAAMEADPAWREVTVSPVVSGDVIERTARALHAWDVEGGPCEGPWESLTPEQHEVWLSGARALADAGLLAEAGEES